MPMTTSASRASALAAEVPVEPTAADGTGVIPVDRALAGVGVGDRDAGRRGEGAQLLGGLGIHDPAAGDDERPLGRADDLDGPRERRGLGHRPADVPDPLAEEARRASRRPRPARPAAGRW
jgi:hypothetical protein